MTRSKPRQRANHSSRAPNVLALLILAGAVGVLYFNYNPRPIGSDPNELTTPSASTAVPPPLFRQVAYAGEESSLVSQSMDDKTALLLSVMLLERGAAKLKDVPDYSATFARQERVNGTLGEPQIMQLKLRHEPLSIYMKWLTGDKGRELVYVEGENDGDMFVHPGGWKSKVVPSLKLDPLGATAMKESRHPVTKIGLAQLTQEVLQAREAILESPANVRCQFIENQPLGDRTCYCFVTEYPEGYADHDFRKGVIYIDRESLLPICVQNYGWPETEEQMTSTQLDRETLAESFSYTGIRFRQQLVSLDFSKNNPKYEFGR